MCLACPAGEACVGGKCACDPSTCDGCCTADGCIPTSSEGHRLRHQGRGLHGLPERPELPGGACVCDAKECPNGCCNNGICVPSTSQTPASCGKGGAACASCAAGLDCVAGSCKCDATTCANGCCDANGVCQPGNKGEACGTAGASCASCGAGQDCTGGSCSCNATTCPDGCCDAKGVCQKHSAGACGTAGGACSVCRRQRPGVQLGRQLRLRRHLVPQRLLQRQQLRSLRHPDQLVVRHRRRRLRRLQGF